MVSSRLIIDDAEILIEHQSLTDTRSYREKGIYLESISHQNNTLSTITINHNLVVHIFWEFHSCAKLVEILYIPETKVLFLGCERHKQFVLETGELQCFL